MFKHPIVKRLIKVSFEAMHYKHQRDAARYQRDSLIVGITRLIHAQDYAERELQTERLEKLLMRVAIAKACEDGPDEA